MHAVRGDFDDFANYPETKVVKIVNKNEYLDRLYLAYESTNDIKLKKFIYQEIKKILIQQGLWSKVST